METRILLPKCFQIIFKNQRVNASVKGKGIVTNLSTKSGRVGGASSGKVAYGANKQKPTSSSGCDVEDSEDSDSEFDATDTIESSGGETDCEGLKISKIWNPSYNLRRPRNQAISNEAGNPDGNEISEEKPFNKGGENGGDACNSNDCGVVVANADSNEHKESAGKAGQFIHLRLCAGRRIESGTILSPNEGEVAVYFIQDVPPIENDDICFVFGCFDRVVQDDPKGSDEERSRSGADSPECNQIRLCNWVRFLRHSVTHKGATDPSVNCVGKYIDGEAIFEFTRTVATGEEILAYFDLKSLTDDKKVMKSTVSSKHGQNQAVPLDLSKSPEAPLELEVRQPTSPESASSDSASSASSPKPGSMDIFPFSINSVLQPSKLFQPYNHQLISPRHPRPPFPAITSQPSVSERSNIFSMTSITGNLRPSLGFQTNSTTVRPILRTRGRERSLLPCEVCGKAFDRPSLLKRHMRTHTGEKPHICDVCSKGFSTSSSLNTHRRIHSGEKPHQCPICGKRFTASSNLYYHRMTHNKEKPHKCLLCGKSFPTPGDLKSHQYVHSGSWPYNCPVCHRGFSKQTNLRNHLLLHSGDKPHSCQVCGKKFALACNLRAHVRTHEEEPVSSCISCKRTFLSSLNMLDNGQCRTCIIHQQQNSSNSGTSNAPIFAPVIPTSSTLNGANVNTKSSQSLALSVSKLTGATSSIAASPIPFPTPGGVTLNESILAGFPPGLPSAAATYLGDTVNLLRPNPFLEHIFQWNWRFAKETAGNLGLMQQKLLESQMLAAQLMSVSQNPAGGVAGTDILKFRL